MASLWMDEAVGVAAMMVMSCVWPSSLAFWYFSHQDLRVLQWVRWLAYVSMALSCCEIQSLASWYHTVLY